MTTIDELRGWSDHEIDNMSRLGAAPGGNYAQDDTTWRKLVQRLRDELVEAFDEGRMDVPRRRREVFHELADGLVPAYTVELYQVLAMVGSAWSVELDRFVEEHAMVFTEWSCVTTDGSTIESPVRQALYVAFFDAFETLAGEIDEVDEG